MTQIISAFLIDRIENVPNRKYLPIWKIPIYFMSLSQLLLNSKFFIIFSRGESNN